MIVPGCRGAGVPGRPVWVLSVDNGLIPDSHRQRWVSMDQAPLEAPGARNPADWLGGKWVAHVRELTNGW